MDTNHKIDRNELMGKLNRLAECIHNIECEVRHLPHRPDIDEQYKVDKCFGIDLEKIDAAIKKAESLWDDVESIKETLKW